MSETDLGKVTLYTLLSLNDRQKDSTKIELSQLSKMASRHPDLVILGQFAFDVGAKEQLSHKLIAKELNKLGYIDD